MLDKKNLEIILHNDDIMEKIKKIAKDLDEKYEGQNPVIIGIMKGAVYFMTDLTSNMNIDLEIDIMCLSSYGESSKSSGKVKILKDIDIDIENRPVIVLEDIVDTGTTLAYLKEYFKYQNAKSVETISIFQKDGTNTKGIKADVIGFVLPDFFLVGYGLDYANRYRHLKHVYKVLKI